MIHRHPTRALLAAGVGFCIAVACLVSGCSQGQGMTRESWIRIAPEQALTQPVESEVLPVPGVAVSSDAWPRLSGELEPLIVRALPGYLSGSFPDTGHLVLVCAPLGAVEEGGSADILVCADLSEWEVRRGMLRCAWRDSNTVRFRFMRAFGGWHLTAVFGEPDGEQRPQVPLLPAWAEARAQRFYDTTSLQSAATTMAAAWAGLRMPKDRLVRQPPRSFADPHRHSPSLDSVRMLAPAYQGMRIRSAGKMRKELIDDRWDESWKTTDGCFHLWYPADGPGMLLEDTRRGQAYYLEGPGQVPPDEPELRRIVPAWVGHTLVIDLCDDPLGQWDSVIHYEIDCDKLTVVRAIPLGPNSLNPVQR